MHKHYTYKLRKLLRRLGGLRARISTLIMYRSEHAHISACTHPALHVLPPCRPLATAALRSARTPAACQAHAYAAVRLSGTAAAAACRPQRLRAPAGCDGAPPPTRSSFPAVPLTRVLGLQRVAAAARDPPLACPTAWVFGWARGTVGVSARSSRSAVAVARNTQNPGG